MKNEYLSDEELLRLIDEVEENAMLRAPAYLKQRILKEIQSAERMPARQSVKKYQTNIRRQLLVYELKGRTGSGGDPYAVPASGIRPGGTAGGARRELWSGFRLSVSLE